MPAHWWELLPLILLALLFFGPKRLPEMGSAIGRTIKEFQKSMRDIGEPSAAPPAVPPATEQRLAQLPQPSAAPAASQTTAATTAEATASTASTASEATAS